MKYCLVILLCMTFLLTACGRAPEPLSEGAAPDSSAVDSAPASTDAPVPPQPSDGSGTDSSATTSTEHGDNAATMNWDDNTAAPGPAATTTKAPSTTTTTTPAPVATGTTVAAGMRLPAAGFSLDGKLQVAQASAAGNVVTLVFRNATRNMETDRDASTVTYVCLDKAGNELLTAKLSPGRIHAGKDSKALAVTVPAGTAELRLTAFDIEYWTDGFR